MDKNDAQSRLMDYLYDEMEPAERREFEEILHDDQDLQKELDDMQSMRKLLQEDNTEIKPGNMLLIKPDRDPTEFDRSGSAKRGKIFTLATLAAIAAAILLSFAVFSFMNLQISHTDRGTLISFGSETLPQETNEPDQTEEYITKAEFYDMIDELQNRNSQVMATALQQTREQHQQQMEDVIQTLTTYYDQRRQQDLILVSEGLAQLEEETYYKFLQTEETLEDLIFAFNVQQTDE